MPYKKLVNFASAVIASLTLFLCLFSAQNVLGQEAGAAPFVDEKWYGVIERIFAARNENLLSGSVDNLKAMYMTNERNGQWAFEQEVKRAKYLRNWSEKQGVVFWGINSEFVIRSAKQVGRGYAFYVVASTEYRYSYQDDPETENSFKIGTYHSLDIIPGEVKGTWKISREWYNDPFADSLDLNKLKTDEITKFILSQTRPALKLSKRRTAAVEYADQYCGAAGGKDNNFQYNRQYRNFNSEGGDCANFASQILFEGGGFPKTSSWNYRKNEASKAWVNAQAFKNFLIWSGRGSYIAKGTYSQVYKASYKLMPGDIVAYEKGGKIVHISIATGLDSKGYALVNSHNTDRWRVPWDLGWGNSGIKFHLIRVHY